MKVSELIERLKVMNQDSEVVVSGSFDADFTSNIKFINKSLYVSEDKPTSFFYDMEDDDVVKDCVILQA